QQIARALAGHVAVLAPEEGEKQDVLRLEDGVAFQFGDPVAVGLLALEEEIAGCGDGVTGRFAPGRRDEGRREVCGGHGCPSLGPRFILILPSGYDTTPRRACQGRLSAPAAHSRFNWWRIIARGEAVCLPFYWPACWPTCLL